MTTPITPEQHRQLGVDLFNAAWALLDRSDRTPEDDDLLIHTAHASAYHWRQVGEPVHFARGDWQLSRVYAVLGRPDAALVHARHSLMLCEANGIGDFDLAFAHEALARAYTLGGQTAAAARSLAAARAAAEQIAEDDDRAYLLAELATIPGA